MHRVIMLLVAMVGIGYGGEIAFALVNKSGHDFSRVWLAKHSSNRWGSSLIKEVLKTGEGIEIKLPNREGWQAWDLRVQYSRRDYEVWQNFETNIYRITIEVLPDGRWNAHYEFKTS